MPPKVTQCLVKEKHELFWHGMALSNENVCEDLVHSN